MITVNLGTVRNLNIAYQGIFTSKKRHRSRRQ